VVTFKQSNPVGSRVIPVALEGGGAILNNGATYTFATNDFMNAGSDGYAMLNDGQGTSQELLSQVVADHLQNAGPISPTIAGRIIIVP
jgi:2',3'-cyclic-nucleotide 2'-phosphodiesterase (5'-nucleotidase family)